MSDPASSTSQLLANLFQGCWACGTFNTLGAIGLSLADTMFSKLASGMTILIGLFMALWILWFAAKLFLPFGAPGSSHWNMGASKLFKLLIVLAFLQSSGPFWNYIFTPTLSVGLGIASQLATATDEYEKYYGTVSEVPSSGPNAVNYCDQSPPPPDSRVALSDNAKSAFAALEQMDCPMSQMQSVYGKGILIGVSVMRRMGCNESGFSFLPSQMALLYFATGLILVGFFLFGFLVFPFLLIDVLTRVILVAVTSPIAIAATLFHPTAKIAERSLWSLLHCGLTLMFGAAIAGINKALIAYIMSQIGTSTLTSLTDWTGLTNSLEDACKTKLTIDLTSASFYMLIGTALITIYMMRRASHLASELTGVSGGTGAQAAFASVAGGAAWLTGKVGQELYKRSQDRRKERTRQASDVAGNNQSNRGNQSGKVAGTGSD